VAKIQQQEIYTGDNMLSSYCQTKEEEEIHNYLLLKELLNFFMILIFKHQSMIYYIILLLKMVHQIFQSFSLQKQKNFLRHLSSLTLTAATPSPLKSNPAGTM
jgi:hypothetical protein